MRKTAIFTEGQSELIFVRKLIDFLYPIGQVNYECFKLIGDNLRSVPYETSYPGADKYILLINVENDSRVISAIKEREQNLFIHGFEAIIGVRDMYCEFYLKSAKNINPTINNKIIDLHRLQIQQMQNPENISIFFEIMEFEAWLLTMYKIFEKLNNSLTVENINSNLGFDLSAIDPEIEFFHPANIVSQILNLVNINYDKSDHLMEGILSKIEDDDILQVIEHERCESLRAFLGKLGQFA